nr:hypothetical protein [Desulforhabdus sp. TSK]
MTLDNAGVLSAASADPTGFIAGMEKPEVIDEAQRVPVRGNRQNYSVLGRDRHHCHLGKGRPTVVAVWEVRDKEIRLVEVAYAGTHEKAPY